MGVIERMQEEILQLRKAIIDLQSKAKPMIQIDNDGVLIANNIIAKSYMKKVKSQQEIRDDVIRTAKVDLEVLTFKSSLKSEVPKFIVNREKKVVVCLMGKADLELMYSNKKGIAKCFPTDCFNVFIGKVISIRRAMGLDIPKEYLNIPQPTKVEVGDILNWEYSGDYAVLKKQLKGEGAYYSLKLLSTGQIFDNLYYKEEAVIDRIVSDSRE